MAEEPDGGECVMRPLDEVIKDANRFWPPLREEITIRRELEEWETRLIAAYSGPPIDHPDFAEIRRLLGRTEGETQPTVPKDAEQHIEMIHKRLTNLLQEEVREIVKDVCVIKPPAPSVAMRPLEEVIKDANRFWPSLKEEIANRRELKEWETRLVNIMNGLGQVETDFSRHWADNLATVQRLLGRTEGEAKPTIAEEEEARRRHVLARLNRNAPAPSAAFQAMVEACKTVKRELETIGWCDDKYDNSYEKTCSALAMAEAELVGAPPEELKPKGELS